MAASIPKKPQSHKSRGIELHQKRIGEALSFPILLSDQIAATAKEAESFKFECSEVAKQVERLRQMLRSAAQVPAAQRPPSCRDDRLRCRLPQAPRLALLDSSAADMKWILSILDGGGGIVLTLPPIASNDPIIAWVWALTVALHVGQLQDKIEAANELASLAKDNDRNKQIILLNDRISSEAQIAAASSLLNLSNDRNRVQAIIEEHGAPIIAQILENSAVKAQIKVASLVAEMAQNSPLAQKEFTRENINKESPVLSLSSSPYSSLSAQMKLELKTSCAKALWMLARGCGANSRRIAETKGLLYLAKLVEVERGELQMNCLMSLTEITSAAETNADLRRTAFKTNSPAAKAVVDQLIRVVQESDDPLLRVASIRAVGCLARTFPARETRVLGPLVALLGQGDEAVAAEAAAALGKFGCPDNFLCVQHCKTIIEFGGVPPLMRLLRSSNEKAPLHGVILTCYLAIHAEKSDDLERAGVAGALEGIDRALILQHPELKELIPQAIYHLTVFHHSHSGMLTER
ncbi:ARM REPEAT PROTEIN INTERACTING WITH ABF2-like [Salvia divinorum]|uniref:ARM REPEAT PROTEIN INTERACTING WITH ABF2-like n=1 Tax=Salvia divinorum TaxID=28513 RepID=A0ABD1G8G4_SALDI